MGYNELNKHVAFQSDYELLNSWSFSFQKDLNTIWTQNFQILLFHFYCLERLVWVFFFIILQILKVQYRVTGKINTCSVKFLSFQTKLGSCNCLHLCCNGISSNQVLLSFVDFYVPIESINLVFVMHYFKYVIPLFYIICKQIHEQDSKFV